MRIALVTPFAWGTPSAVNDHVALLARELARRGHRPLIVASSDHPDELRRMRLLTRRKEDLGLHLLREWQAGAPPDPRLLPPPDDLLGPEVGIPVYPLGRSFSIRANGAVANLGLPVDLMARLEHLLAHGAFEVVHVHEPLAPSLSFTAIREARSPVVATFHLTPAGLRGYELGQGLLPRFYERLDGRIVTSPAAVPVLTQAFPGEYTAISPGSQLAFGLAHRIQRGAHRPERAPPDRSPPRGGRLSTSTAVTTGARSARSSGRSRWSAVAACGGWWSRCTGHRPIAGRPAPRPARLQHLVEWREFGDARELAPLYGEADVVVLPFLGGEWLLSAAADAVVSGVPLAGPDLPLTREALLGASAARLFSPSREPSLAEALDDLLEQAASHSPSSIADRHYPSAVAAAVEEEYRRAARLARPSPAVSPVVHPGRFGAAPPSPRRAVRLLARAEGGSPGEGWIHADLHVHTSHSKDCRSPVAAVVATAAEVGLDAIAIADHNTITGAVEARDLAGDGLYVIVAEEVMTQQGEVIGLFLQETVPAGLTFDATLSLIKQQGGLVYVPHPFDRLHTTPSYRSLVDNLHRIDVIETYNARLAFSGFNANAERFAAKYNLAAGAGSDAHVLPGLGTAMLRMRSFTGPDDFLAALREVDIVARRKSLFYLQSLKLLQNTLDLVLPGG